MDHWDQMTTSESKWLYQSYQDCTLSFSFTRNKTFHWKNEKRLMNAQKKQRIKRNGNKNYKGHIKAFQFKLSSLVYSLRWAESNPSIQKQHLSQKILLFLSNHNSKIKVLKYSW